MNEYVSIDKIDPVAVAAGTTNDAALLSVAYIASQKAERYCDRRFWVMNEARYFDGPPKDVLLLDDLLSVTEFVGDTDCDGSFDDQTWTAGTDYLLEPYNSYPKTMARQAPNPTEFFYCLPRAYKITGAWGFGDGVRADPFETTSITGTVADASSTALTVSANGIYPGTTIRIGTEVMAVTARGSLALTVIRGINGTTAAAHAAGVISTALFPGPVIDACAQMAIRLKASASSAGIVSERIGDYSVQYAGVGDSGSGGMTAFESASLDPFKRRRF